MNKHEQGSGINLNYVLWVLWRRKGFIVLSIFLGLALAHLFTLFVPPKYVASAQLLFDTAAEQIVTPEQELRTSYGVHQLFERAAAMIESPGILKPVALKIVNESAGQLSPEAPISKVLSNPGLTGEERTILLIDRLQKSLTTKMQAADQVLVLEYKSTHPGEAAFIANLIAATFLEHREETRKSSLAQATEWLDQRSVEAKDRLIAIDRKIQEFKALHRIENEMGSTALEAELTRKRDRLSAAETRLAEAQTDYETLRPRVAPDTRESERAAEGIGDAALQRLRSSQLAAETDLAATKARLGSSHPDVQAKESQVAAIKTEIAVEIHRKQVSSKIELDQIASREQALKEEIRSIESRIYEVKAAEVQLGELQREREAVRTLYDSMLAKLTQANLQQTLNFAQFRILLNATVPTRPKLPPALIWVGGAMAGLGFGLFASLIWELLQGRLVNSDQARRQLPVKLITQVPLITEKDFDVKIVGNQRSFQHFANNFPASLFTNKLLSVHLAVDTIEGDATCKVIIITSSMQGAGKTHICSNLAGLSVLLGYKSLLINLDARKNHVCEAGNGGRENPELTSFLKASGLEGVLTQTSSMEEGGYDELSFQTASEADSIRFFQMQAKSLFDFARRNYDYVWIDTPPAGIFNDPLSIARHVDGVIIVAEWSKTTIKQLKDTINLIDESHGYVLGVLMNKVRPGRLMSDSMMSYAKYYSGTRDRDLLGQKVKAARQARSSV